MEEAILDSKIYELVLNAKNHTEDRRDEINKYYTSLFAAIVSIMPFIDKITKAGASGLSSDTIQISLMVLSLIGLVLSISWVATLKRIYNFLEALDKLLITLENKYQKSFITYVSAYLLKINAPDRVTKQVMLVPYTFALIFIGVFVYTLLCISKII